MPKCTLPQRLVTDMIPTTDVRAVSLTLHILLLLVISSVSLASHWIFLDYTVSYTQHLYVLTTFPWACFLITKLNRMPCVNSFSSKMCNYYTFLKMKIIILLTYHFNVS